MRRGGGIRHTNEGGPGKAGLKDQTDTLLDLLDRHGSDLYALLHRLTLSEHVAEDLLQELFMKLRDSKSFAAADRKLAYARRSAMNLAIDWRRSHKRHVSMEQIDPNMTATNPSPASRLVQHEQFEQILDATSRLGNVSRYVTRIDITLLKADEFPEGLFDGEKLLEGAELLGY